MQFASQAKPPAGVIFDCDLGNQIDDVLALALLYGLDGKNETRVVSLSVTNSNLKAAGLCEAISRFYSTSKSPFYRPLPIGFAANGKMAADNAMLTEPLSRKNAEGAPQYLNDIHRLNDTAEPLALIRNAFSSQHDQNCIAVLGGPATNFAGVLDVDGAKELIARKVRYLVVSGGAYPEGGPEFNIKTDIAAARKLFAEWPTPIVAAGVDIGDSVLYPASSIEKDFAWSPAHPVVDAYRANKPMPYDAPAGDMLSILYAVRPQEGYFKVSEAGTITVAEDGRTKFTANPSGKHRYLIPDPAQKDRILKTITEIASAKPVVRVFRPRVVKDADKPKPDPAKPDPSKPETAKPDPPEP